MPKFMAKLDADALRSFLGHRQCNTHNTRNSKLWPIASD
jgi:hypothetical protein